MKKSYCNTRNRERTLTHVRHIGLSLLLATLLLSGFSAFAQTNILVGQAGDYGLAGAGTNVYATLTLTYPNPRVESGVLIRRDPMVVYCNTNGNFYYTNILWGRYQLTLSGNLGTVFPVNVGTNTTGTVNIGSLVNVSAAMPPNPATNYYTQAQIDSKLTGLGNGGGVTNNQVLPGTPVDGGGNPVVFRPELLSASNSLYGAIIGGGINANTATQIVYALAQAASTTLSNWSTLQTNDFVTTNWITSRKARTNTIQELAGYGTFDTSQGAFMGNGDSNVLTTSPFSAVISGSGANLTDSPGSFIGSGNDTFAAHQQSGFVGSGMHNGMTTSAGQTQFQYEDGVGGTTTANGDAGYNTMVNTHLSWIGGDLEDYPDGFYYGNFIGGGTVLNMRNGSTNSVITGGFNNYVNKGRYAAILGGSSNQVQGASMAIGWRVTNAEPYSVAIGPGPGKTTVFRQDGSVTFPKAVTNQGQVFYYGGGSMTNLYGSSGAFYQSVDGGSSSTFYDGDEFNGGPILTLTGGGSRKSQFWGAVDFTGATVTGIAGSITATDATNAAMGVMTWTNPVTQTQFAAALTNQETRGLQFSNSVQLFANGGTKSIELDNVDGVVSAGSFTGTSPGAFNGDGSALTGINVSQLEGTMTNVLQSVTTNAIPALTLEMGKSYRTNLAASIQLAAFAGVSNNLTRGVFLYCNNTSGGNLWVTNPPNSTSADGLNYHCVTNNQARTFYWLTYGQVCTNSYTAPQW